LPAGGVRFSLSCHLSSFHRGQDVVDLTGERVGRRRPLIARRCRLDRGSLDRRLGGDVTPFSALTTTAATTATTARTSLILIACRAVFRGFGFALGVTFG
jgi:hypothetical protein